MNEIEIITNLVTLIGMWMKGALMNLVQCRELIHFLSNSAK